MPFTVQPAFPNANRSTHHAVNPSTAQSIRRITCVAACASGTGAATCHAAKPSSDSPAQAAQKPHFCAALRGERYGRRRAAHNTNSRQAATPSRPAVLQPFKQRQGQHRLAQQREVLHKPTGRVRERIEQQMGGHAEQRAEHKRHGARAFGLETETPAALPVWAKLATLIFAAQKLTAFVFR